MENKNSNVTTPRPSTKGAKWEVGRTECPPEYVSGPGEGLVSRGLRNNNPLNIRHSKSRWKGMAKTQTDSAFVQFESMAYGYRAAFVLLRTYRKKYGCNTLRKIISRWAPPNENNTQRYIQNVSQWTGINPDKLIAGQDAVSYIQIVAAMSRMEVGKPLSPLSPNGERASQSERSGAVNAESYGDEWIMAQILEGWRLANKY